MTILLDPAETSEYYVPFTQESSFATLLYEHPARNTAATTGAPRVSASQRQPWHAARQAKYNGNTFLTTDASKGPRIAWSPRSPTAPGLSSTC